MGVREKNGRNTKRDWGRRKDSKRKERSRSTVKCKRTRPEREK